MYCSSAIGELRQALSNRSARDWPAIVANGTAELDPSGRLIVAGGGASADGMSQAED